MSMVDSMHAGMMVSRFVSIVITTAHVSCTLSRWAGGTNHPVKGERPGVRRFGGARRGRGNKNNNSTYT